MAAAIMAPAGPGEDTTILRERLHLLEQDRKAFFENSQNQIRANRDAIKKIRDENKQMKAMLTAAQKGQTSVHAKEINSLDENIYKATLKLDRTRDEIAQRLEALHEHQQQLKEIEVESQPFLTEESYLTRKILMLENRLDKSLIKYNEAQAIRKTYEDIVRRLKEERVGFDNQLAAIERTLKAKDHDYQELLNMSHDANHAKELAKMELQQFKVSFEEKRRLKDKELAERKKYVQSKIEQTQRLERKEKQLRQQIADEEARKAEGENQPRTGALVAASGRGENAFRSPEEEERFAQYESAFRTIKEATGVSDVQEVIQKFLSQEETHRNLVQMTREAQNRIDALNTEKSDLMSKIDELRYSGSGQLGSRRIVEEFEVHLREVENTTRANSEKYERLARLLISVKAGVEHLADKLSGYRAELPTPPMSDDTLIDILRLCEQKLQGLVDEVVPADAAEEALITTTIELPMHNRRVKLQRDEEEDDNGDDDADLQDEDDDAVLKREQVKKISVNSIQRETKKLKRKKKEKL